MFENLRSLIFRVLTIWFVIMIAETVHGILRKLFLEPQVGELRAKQIGVLLGSLLVLAVTLIFIRWLSVRSWLKLLTIGIVWVNLTLAFETILGVFVLNLPWSAVAADYDISQGGLMLFGLLVMLLAPLAAAKVRGTVL